MAKYIELGVNEVIETDELLGKKKEVESDKEKSEESNNGTD